MVFTYGSYALFTILAFALQFSPWQKTSPDHKPQEKTPLFQRYIVPNAQKNPQIHVKSRQPQGGPTWGLGFWVLVLRPCRVVARDLKMLCKQEPGAVLLMKSFRKNKKTIYLFCCELIGCRTAPLKMPRELEWDFARPSPSRTLPKAWRPGFSFWSLSLAQAVEWFLGSQAIFFSERCKLWMKTVFQITLVSCKCLWVFDMTKTHSNQTVFFPKATLWNSPTADGSSCCFFLFRRLETG